MIAPLLQGVMVLQERHGVLQERYGKIITGRFCLSTKFARICWDMLALTSRIHRNCYKLPLGFLQNTCSDCKNSSPKTCKNCSKKIATTQVRALHQTYIWPASFLKPETNQNPNCLDGDQQRQPTKYHDKSDALQSSLLRLAFPWSWSQIAAWVYFGNCHVGENWETLVTFGILLGEKLSETT